MVVMAQMWRHFVAIARSPSQLGRNPSRVINNSRLSAMTRTTKQASSGLRLVIAKVLYEIQGSLLY